MHVEANVLETNDGESTKGLVSREWWTRRGMNNAAKWTMIVGGLLVGFGILFSILFGSRLSDLEADENWVPEESSWNGQTGVFEALEERNRGEGEQVSYLVYVKDRSNSISDQCRDFSLTVNNTNEESRNPEWTHDWCDETGDRPWGWEDDPPGYWHLGKISVINVGESYEISASEEIYLIHEDLIGEIIGEAIGGALGIFGSGGCACCGVVVLLIGIVMALTMEDETGPTEFQVDEQGRIILNQGAVFEASETPASTEVSDPGEGTLDDAEAWYKEN